MARFRILTLLALVLALVGLEYGYDSLNTFPRENDLAHFFLACGLLILTAVSGLSVVSSIAIFFLSFFAVEYDNGGSIAITQDNLYGRLFLKLLELSPAKEYTLCQIFWITNLNLFAASISIGTISVLAFMLWKEFSWEGFKFVALGLGIFIAVVGGLVGVIYLGWKLFLRVTKTKFGIFYDNYLCPRIKVR